ncbi:hypothetical protein AMK34_13730 [Amycolatopsis sp. CB00013]|nr:hypothetical protein AMK34_13730 [Amycolatopsis sp. CB00013]
MISEAAASSMGVLAVTAFALRYAIQLLIVLWSLRADEAGRTHAIRLLELLRGRRPHHRPLPGSGELDRDRSQTAQSLE